MEKQVDKSHYDFRRYIHKQRWASMWYQLQEVVRLEPFRVLEVGPGPGIFVTVAKKLGISVETLDIDPELEPDHVGSALEMPFEDKVFDVVCAFQVLEHMPYEESLRVLHEMGRVAAKGVVISLPDAAPRWPMSVYVPKVGQVNFSVPRPTFGVREHVFDGEHFWELNKKGYGLNKIQQDMGHVCGFSHMRTYCVPENPYHRFFIFSHENILI